MCGGCGGGAGQGGGGVPAAAAGPGDTLHLPPRGGQHSITHHDMPHKYLDYYTKGYL